jgi:hypothetical protein
LLTEVHLGALHDIDAPRSHALDISETGVVSLLIGAEGGGSFVGVVHIAQNPALEQVFLRGVDSTGVVLVYGNPELRSLAADTLRLADGVEVSGNPRLSHLWMDRLSRIAGTLLVRDTALVDLVHFGNVTEAGALAVVSNPVLRTMGALTSVRAIRNVTITGNPALTSLIGLDRVEAITGNLTIADNASLPTLEGLGHARVVAGSLAIQGCPGLATLAGLDALRVIGGDLAITGNALLSSLAGTERLVEVGAAVAVTDNAQLPAAEIAGLMTRIGRLP